MKWLNDTTNQQDTVVKDSGYMVGKDRRLSIHETRQMCIELTTLKRGLISTKWEGSRQFSDMLLSQCNEFLDAHEQDRQNFQSKSLDIDVLRGSFLKTGNVEMSK